MPVEEPSYVEVAQFSSEIVDKEANNYMPIKALNTFSKDWVIKARVSNKALRPTQKGGHILKLELVDN